MLLKKRIPALTLRDNGCTIIRHNVGFFFIIVIHTSLVDSAFYKIQHEISKRLPGQNNTYQCLVVT